MKNLLFVTLFSLIALFLCHESKAQENIKSKNSIGYIADQYPDKTDTRVYQWDDCFMTMFYNIGYPLVPGIGSLDNFYAHQFP